MLLCTLGRSLFGNLLTGKGIVRAASGNNKGKGNEKGKRNKKGKAIVRAGTRKHWNFEIQKYYKNEPRFNGVFSRNNLPKKIKDGAYVINLDEYTNIDTHWIALFCNKNEMVYCVFLKKLKNLLEIKTWKLPFFEYKQTIQ